MTVEFELVKIYMNDIYCPYTLSSRFADSREVYAIKVEGEYFVLGEKGSGVYRRFGGRMVKFWTKLKLYAEKKEQETWLAKHHCDQKCPKCNTWQGNCGGWSEVVHNIPTDMNEKTKCGKCGQWTTWFDVGMGFLVADDITGQPLK